MLTRIKEVTQGSILKSRHRFQEWRMNALAALWILAAGWTLAAPQTSDLRALFATPEEPAPVLLALPKTLEASRAAALARQVWSPEALAQYYSIFSYQSDGNWLEADRLIRRLSDAVLLGYVLGERYLDARYTPTAEELATWLKAFSDLPQATDVYRRFFALYPEQAQNIATPAAAPVKTRGVALRDFPAAVIRDADKALWKQARRTLAAGDAEQAYQQAEQLLKISGEENLSAYWLAGIAAWDLDRPLQAARHFTAMANASDQLPPEHAAAAAYWAARAFERAEMRPKAVQYLSFAASYPDTFYGMIASAKLGAAEQEQASPDGAVSSETLAASAVVREVLLLEALGKHAAAEARALTALTSIKHRERLTLAHLAQAIDLTTVAAVTGASGAYTRYPVPEWISLLPRNSDRPLVLAIARHESGFNASAISPRGASGLMQIMPETANFLVRRGSPVIQASWDADAASADFDLKDIDDNLRLGAAYIDHLASQPYIGGNLVYLLAAYNAGPGSVQRWQETFGTDDPLLFIETLPFEETQAYIKQVLESYWMYKRLLDGRAPAFDRLTHSNWPRA